MGAIPANRRGEKDLKKTTTEKAKPLPLCIFPLLTYILYLSSSSIIMFAISPSYTLHNTSRLFYFLIWWAIGAQIYIFSVIQNERFRLVFAKTGSIISGTVVCWPLPCLCRPFMIVEGCLDSNLESFKQVR